MLLNFKAFVFFSVFCGLYRSRQASAESNECFLVTCEGEGCLYPSILTLQATSFAPTCTTTEHEACLVKKEYILGGALQMSAMCGPDCDTEPTTTERVGIFKRRKRSVPDLECCYSDRCNHDGPCGSLTCSAGVSVVTRTVNVAALLVSVALI